MFCCWQQPLIVKVNVKAKGGNLIQREIMTAHCCVAIVSESMEWVDDESKNLSLLLIYFLLVSHPAKVSGLCSAVRLVRLAHCVNGF